MTLDLRTIKVVSSTLPNAKLYASADGRIVCANQAAAELLGRSAQDLNGSRFHDLCDEAESDVTEILAQYLRVGTPVFRPLNIRTANGDIMRIRCDGHRLPGTLDGKPLLMLKLSSVDECASEFAALNQRFMTVERALRFEHAINRDLRDSGSQKTTYLAQFGHELRSPLTAVIGFATMIRHFVAGTRENPKIEEYAGLIINGSHHLLDVINSLMDISLLEARAYPLSEEPVDLSELVRKAVPLAATGVSGDEDQRLQLHVPDSLPLVMADASALSQTVVNLVNNALKFTPANGTIAVRTGCDRGGNIFLEVADTGCGIPPDEISRVLQPFSQTRIEKKEGHRRGAGLGLAVCERIVRLHDGHLDIKSTLGQGTTVTISLPPSRAITPKRMTYTRNKDRSLPPVANPIGVQAAK